MSDLRFASRSLRRTPTLTLAAVLTLALCIGATTAIFSVVYAVLFRPLPFADPNGILVVRETWKGQQGSMSAGNWCGHEARRPDVPVPRAHDRRQRRTWRAPTRPENVTGARVGWPTSSRCSGSQPALGRGFLPDEDRPGADGVVVLSDGLWRRRFGADPAIVGRESGSTACRTG